VTRGREHHRLPVKGGNGPEAKLFAKLVALHISAHPAIMAHQSVAVVETVSRSNSRISYPFCLPA
jgi:hypothetical protein